MDEWRHELRSMDVGPQEGMIRCPPAMDMLRQQDWGAAPVLRWPLTSILSDANHRVGVSNVGDGASSVQGELPIGVLRLQAGGDGGGRDAPDTGKRVGEHSTAGHCRHRQKG